jgi:hypothetical protein
MRSGSRRNEADQRAIGTAQAERLLAGLSAAHRAELERLAPLLQTLLAHFRGAEDKDRGQRR